MKRHVFYNSEAAGLCKEASNALGLALRHSKAVQVHGRFGEIGILCV